MLVIGVLSLTMSISLKRGQVALTLVFVRGRRPHHGSFRMSSLFGRWCVARSVSDALGLILTRFG